MTRSSLLLQHYYDLVEVFEAFVWRRNLVWRMRLVMVTIMVERRITMMMLVKRKSIEEGRIWCDTGESLLSLRRLERSCRWERMTLCVALYVRFGKVVVVCKLWEGKAILEGVVGYCWVYRCLGDCFEVFRSAHDWKGVILRVSTIHLGPLFVRQFYFLWWAKMCDSSFRDLDDAQSCARNFPHAIKMDSNVHWFWYAKVSGGAGNRTLYSEGFGLDVEIEHEM